MGNEADLHGLVHEYHLFIIFTFVAALINATVCRTYEVWFCKDIWQTPLIHALLEVWRHMLLIFTVNYV